MKKVSPIVAVGLALGMVIAFINFINRRRTRLYERAMVSPRGVSWSLFAQALIFAALKGMIYGVAWPASSLIIFSSLLGFGPSFESHFVPLDIPALDDHTD